MGHARLVLTAAVFAACVCAPAANATFPGKNGRLAITAGEQDDEIYLADPRAKDRRPRYVAAGFHPAFSASGRSLLYHHSDPRRGEAAAAALPLSPPDARPFFLTDPSTAMREFEPAPAPGGKRFAYVDRRGLRVAALPSGGRYPAGRTLAKRAVCAAWAPNGRSIAFLSYDGSGRRATIRRVTPRGRALKRVYRGRPDAPIGCPNWAPNSKRLAFSDGDRYRILIVTLSGRVKRKLPLSTDGFPLPPAIDEVAVAFSPSGKLLAYADDVLGLNIINVRTRRSQLLCECGVDVDWRPIRRR